MDDAAGFFANVFGGERFIDYVRSILKSFCSFVNNFYLVIQIGEISIMKDMTEAATTMMTEEEKAEIEKQMNSDGKPPTPPAQSTINQDGPSSTEPSSAAPPPSSDTPAPSDPTNHPSGSSSVVVHGDNSGSPSPSLSHSLGDKEKLERDREAARKRKAEQKEKLREQEKARRKVMEARVEMLTAKMIERLRPFVDAKHPGDKDDSETLAFEARMKREVEDLKLESFGVEVCLECLRAPAMSNKRFQTAPSYHWQCLHDEGYVVLEVQEVLGNVRSSYLVSVLIRLTWSIVPDFSLD